MPLYIRVATTDEKKPSALQTAIVRYKGKKGTKYAGKIVDLVGVVHIGQDEYYADLNKRLAKYDSVLYELVAPDGTRIRPEDLEKRRSLLASMQTGMKDMLNLEYQLELIDYMAENFRHADMSPDEFVEDLERRGDSIWKMVARMMGAGLASSGFDRWRRRHVVCDVQQRPFEENETSHGQATGRHRTGDGGDGRCQRREHADQRPQW